MRLGELLCRLVEERGGRRRFSRRSILALFPRPRGRELIVIAESRLVLVFSHGGSLRAVRGHRQARGRSPPRLLPTMQTLSREMPSRLAAAARGGLGEERATTEAAIPTLTPFRRLTHGVTDRDAVQGSYPDRLDWIRVDAVNHERRCDPLLQRPSWWLPITTTHLPSAAAEARTTHLRPRNEVLYAALYMSWGSIVTDCDIRQSITFIRTHHLSVLTAFSLSTHPTPRRCVFEDCKMNSCRLRRDGVHARVQLSAVWKPEVR